MWSLCFSETVSLLLLTVHRRPQHLALTSVMWILGKVALHCMYAFISASNFRNLPAIQRVAALKMLQTLKTDTFMTQS